MKIAQPAAHPSTRSLSIWGWAVAIAILAGGAADAAPVALYDSINGSSADGSDPASNATWLANQFNTDVATYQLDSVVLDFVTAPLGTIAVDIYSDVSGTPTSNLGTLTNPLVFSNGSNTFTASGILSLEASKSFWVVLRGVGSSIVDWNWTTNTPAGIGTSTNTNFSTTAGASWAGISSGTPYMMTVNATPVAVPEPSTWAMGLAGVGFAGVTALRRRRRRQG